MASVLQRALFADGSSTSSSWIPVLTHQRRFFCALTPHLGKAEWLDLPRLLVFNSFCDTYKYSPVVRVFVSTSLSAADDSAFHHLSILLTSLVSPRALYITLLNENNGSASSNSIRRIVALLMNMTTLRRVRLVLDAATDGFFSLAAADHNRTQWMCFMRPLLMGHSNRLLRLSMAQNLAASLRDATAAAAIRSRSPRRVVAGIGSYLSRCDIQSLIFGDDVDRKSETAGVGMNGGAAATCANNNNNNNNLIKSVCDVLIHEHGGSWHSELTTMDLFSEMALLISVPSTPKHPSTCECSQLLDIEHNAELDICVFSSEWCFQRIGAFQQLPFPENVAAVMNSALIFTLVFRTRTAAQCRALYQRAPLLVTKQIIQLLEMLSTSGNSSVPTIDTQQQQQQQQHGDTLQQQNLLLPTTLAIIMNLLEHDPILTLRRSYVVDCRLLHTLKRLVRMSSRSSDSHHLLDAQILSKCAKIASFLSKYRIRSFADELLNSNFLGALVETAQASQQQRAVVLLDIDCDCVDAICNVIETKLSSSDAHLVSAPSSTSFPTSPFAANERSEDATGVEATTRFFDLCVDSFVPFLFSFITAHQGALGNEFVMQRVAAALSGIRTLRTFERQVACARSAAAAAPKSLASQMLPASKLQKMSVAAAASSRVVDHARISLLKQVVSVVIGTQFFGVAAHARSLLESV